ncbi:MAG: DNA-formamidopyrimidine glycosylase [Solobacterium sp.]|nr:DNA-formamidopyrimidine glycosylase [Solobacterium sp.]
MPELPEVETVLRTLEKKIAGEEILGVAVRYPKMIDRSPEAFAQKLIGKHFLQFERRGKYLLFGMEDVVLCSHLRMEGKYWILPEDAPLDRHTHVIFELADGRQLRYHDTRKFGRMELLEPDFDRRTFHGLGPEPFSPEWNGAYLYRIVKQRSTPIKSLLLDQSVVAGIGNIYADEILFACGIRPRVSSRRLTKTQCEAIVEATRDILSRAIQAGGTTIRSYTSSLGVSGLFQLSCNVHAQKTCQQCGQMIKIVRVGGRSSYYCPRCQK